MSSTIVPEGLFARIRKNLIRVFSSYWLVALLIILFGFLVVILFLFKFVESPFAKQLHETFNDRIVQASETQPLSPLVVTVYERESITLHRNDTLTAVVASRGGGQSKAVDVLPSVAADDIDDGGDPPKQTAHVVAVQDEEADDEPVNVSYNERLIVVKPQNWFIYTNNGLNFYLISNNVSNRTAQCILDRQLIAVEYRLLKLVEPDTVADTTGRLRVACINYSMDNLIRLFGVQANRTYLDLSRYFDRQYNPNAPPIVVDEILNYLLRHRFV